jgi:hypothetical protein
MFGEIVGDNDSTGAASSLSWMVGMCPVKWGTPYGENSGWWHFSSKHRGVINFCMGDGAVRPVLKGYPADHQEFMAYAGWRDGMSP